MTDLTIETFLWCESNERFEIEVEGTETYKVSYGQHIPGPYGANWSCTCPAFKYGGRKECKHIKTAKSCRCAHGEGASYGSPTNDFDDGKCPECGGKAVPVRVGV